MDETVSWIPTIEVGGDRIRPARRFEFPTVAAIPSHALLYANREELDHDGTLDQEEPDRDGTNNAQPELDLLEPDLDRTVPMLPAIHTHQSTD